MRDIEVGAMRYLRTENKIHPNRTPAVILKVEFVSLSRSLQLLHDIAADHIEMSMSINLYFQLNCSKNIFAPLASTAEGSLQLTPNEYV